MSKKKGTPATGIPSKSQAKYTALLLRRKIQKRMLQADPEKELLKKERMLLWLVIASETGIKVTRFDALYVNDTIWNTTVSELGAANRLIINRRPTKRHAELGGLTDCHEYWLQGQSLQSAQASCNRLLQAGSCEVA